MLTFGHRYGFPMRDVRTIKIPTKVVIRWASLRVVSQRQEARF